MSLTLKSGRRRVTLRRRGRPSEIDLDDVRVRDRATPPSRRRLFAVSSVARLTCHPTMLFCRTPFWPFLVATCAFTSASVDVFSNSFLVRFRRAVGRDEAHDVARRHGFVNMGPLLGSSTEYHFINHALPVARTKRSIPHMRKLKVDPLIHSAIQQPGFVRVKRGYKPLKVENLVKVMRPHNDPTDPYFTFQWYLKNTGQNGGKAKLDLNVEAAWAQGVTGKNITTAIMDDGKRS
ncbi:hypothetical protein JTB14_035512 [Gonioctena quinquepunctata]|nr:hypothetical protein JTB14_035512 [Gonioctena quinquepunctata]